MMSYFSYPKGHGPPYNAWYPGMNYHPSTNGQFIDHNEMSSHQAAMYYGNPHIFQASPDWSHEFGSSAPAASGLGANGLQVSAGSHGVPVGLGSGPLAVGVGSASGGANNTSMTSLNISGSGGGSGGGHGQGTNVNDSGSLIASGLQSLPSPPVTVSGSEMSSPGAPAENASPQTSSLDPTPTKSPFQWMTKNPQPTTG